MIKIIRWAASWSYTAPLWTLMIIMLLCIPGNKIPGDGLFGIEHLDKIVHFFLFGFQILFWGIRLWAKQTIRARWREKFFFLLVVILLFGVVMEFVQLYFIPNRSFDRWDIVADSLGALAAYALLLYKGESLKLLNNK
jgi:VanZ like family